MSITKIRIGHRFEINLGDRGFAQLGEDFEAKLPPGASPTEVQHAVSTLERKAKETTAKEAKALLTKIENEIPFDQSVPGSSFQLLRVIIVDGGLDPGEHKCCQKCGKPLPTSTKPKQVHEGWVYRGEPGHGIYVCPDCTDPGEV